MSWHRLHCECGGVDRELEYIVQGLDPKGNLWQWKFIGCTKCRKPLMPIEHKMIKTKEERLHGLFY